MSLLGTRATPGIFEEHKRMAVSVWKTVSNSQHMKLTKPSSRKLRQEGKLGLVSIFVPISLDLYTISGPYHITPIYIEYPRRDENSRAHHYGLDVFIRHEAGLFSYHGLVRSSLYCSQIRYKHLTYLGLVGNKGIQSLCTLESIPPFPTHLQ